ncbi:AsmA family protein, partial [Flavobacterium sp.]|uniref:DUF748 domain-containing protein n=1 Tax=Flavobacterium sp. TaxID=239 RepID=UPI00286E8376
MKRYFVKILKIITYFILIIIGIFLLIALVLQIPKVQYYVKEKTVAYLQTKIKTKIKIDRVEIGLPKLIILEGVYFEDESKKTLLSAKKITVDISLLKLLDNKIEINSVDFNTITANIYTNKNGIFNFDYIIKAFTSPEKSKDDSPPMEFSIDKINLDVIKFTYIDSVSKNNILVNLNHFDAKIKTFDLQNQQIEIKNLDLKNTSASLILDKIGKVKLNEIQKEVTNNWKIKIDKSNLE